MKFHQPLIRGEPTSGEGLAFITANDIVVSPRPLQTLTCSSSYKRQLIDLCIGHQIVVVANIYRPSSQTQSAFLVDFADLLKSLLQSVERLLLCSDFNLPNENNDC